VVAVPELACREPFEADVVLAVRRRHDDGARPCLLEENALERGEA